MIIRNMTASLIGTMHEKKHYALKPGVNDLPPEVWAAWRGTVVMQAMIAAKKVVEPVEEAEKKPTLENLDGLQAKEAVALVAQTFDTELLEKWVTDEKRATVVKAIEKQLDAIEVKAQKPEEPGADDDAESDETPES